MTQNLARILGLAASMALLFALGCGGGGGGGGGGGFNMFLSPTSVSVGPNGEVRLNTIDQNGTFTDVTWAVSAGFLTPLGIGSAQFVAPASGPATVTATSVVSGGIVRTCSVTVVPGMATVTGRVRRSGSSIGLPGVVVDFFDVAATLVATATTNSLGYFSGAVPANAVRFHLRNSSIPTGFYKQYTYDSMRYATTIAACSAPLPGLSAGVSTGLVTECVVSPNVGPPPPPPNGCPP